MKLKMYVGSKHLNILLFSVCILIICACGPNVIEKNKPAIDLKNEALVRVNKYMVKKDADLIKNYIKRHNWIMKETESGLWYAIIKHGPMVASSKGKLVTIKYKVELLDGTLCYSSDSSGYKQFIAGSGKVEAGLDEGIQLLQQGDAAIFILPPHLAFGLIGDNNCIPPRSIILYEVELLKIDDPYK